MNFVVARSFTRSGTLSGCQISASSRYDFFTSSSDAARSEVERMKRPGGGIVHTGLFKTIPGVVSSDLYRYIDRGDLPDRCDPLCAYPTGD